jgi:hypothetical protein
MPPLAALATDFSGPATAGRSALRPPVLAEGPLRASIVIFGQRETAAGREPWVGRLTHTIETPSDLAFAMMALTSAVLAEHIERERAGQPGGHAAIDPEALARRVVEEGEGVFAFDTLFPQGGERAVFHSAPTIRNFASTSHPPIVRLHALDCERQTLHVFGVGSRAHAASSVAQLCRGPVMPLSGLDPRRDAESLAHAQEAVAALLGADWTLNRRSPALDRVAREARNIATPLFEWETAHTMAQRGDFDLRLANREPLGTPMKGDVIARGDFYLIQRDNRSRRLWLHDRTELELGGTRPPALGDELVIAYETGIGPSLRARPLRGHVRLVGPGPEVRERLEASASGASAGSGAGAGSAAGAGANVDLAAAAPAKSVAVGVVGSLTPRTRAGLPAAPPASTTARGQEARGAR